MPIPQNLLISPAEVLRLLPTASTARRFVHSAIFSYISFEMYWLKYCLGVQSSLASALLLLSFPVSLISNGDFLVTLFHGLGTEAFWFPSNSSSDLSSLVSICWTTEIAGGSTSAASSSDRSKSDCSSRLSRTASATAGGPKAKKKMKGTN